MPTITTTSQTELDKISAIRTIDSEIQTLEELKKTISQESLTSALDMMQRASGRIIITGMGKSGHIGRKIAASLASTGTPSFFVHPAEASHGDLGMITEDDVIQGVFLGHLLNFKDPFLSPFHEKQCELDHLCRI